MSASFSETYELLNAVKVFRGLKIVWTEFYKNTDRITCELNVFPVSISVRS